MGILPTETKNEQFLPLSRLFSEVPPELVSQARGREVNVDMEDHHMEEFMEPKRKALVFGGKGHVLGSPAPATVTAAAAPALSDTEKADNEEAAKTAVGVDSSQPNTTVQVRLMDGSRLLVNLNHTHTVGDLRRYITL
jgi:UBX domain-containing protein 1